MDGLHLDFVRYPGPGFDYSRAALEGFRRVDGGSDLLGGPARSPAAWDDYRRAGPHRTRDPPLATRRAAERPGLVLSAAVAPDEAQADAASKFQDWPRWLVETAS